MHMNMYFFFEKFNILCIFRNRFLIRFYSGFFSVPVRFRFLGSTGSMTGSVLATLVLMHSTVNTCPRVGARCYP
jgi:hypothetical protein